jgi:hypothetical protein
MVFRRSARGWQREVDDVGEVLQIGADYIVVRIDYGDSHSVTAFAKDVAALSRAVRKLPPLDALHLWHPATLGDLSRVPARELIITASVPCAAPADFATLGPTTQALTLNGVVIPPRTLVVGALEHVEELALHFEALAPRQVDAPGLLRLVLERPRYEDVRGLSWAPNLVALQLLGARRLQTLSGIGEMKSLRSLRITEARSLEQGALDVLPAAILDVWLNGYRSVESLDFALRLPSLKRLYLENSGSLRSALPVSRLASLESLGIVGDTTFEDPDLQPIIASLSLRTVAIASRARYSPSVQVVEETIEARDR